MNDKEVQAKIKRIIKKAEKEGLARVHVPVELLKAQQAGIERLEEIAKNGNGFIEKCDSRVAQMFSH